MGRSPNFCLSIKSCAGAPPVDADDLTLPENKASPEKRRWSFRKKPVDHHIPSKNVISEPAHTIRRHLYHESTSDNLYSEKAPSDSEKVSTVKQTNLTLLSPIASSRTPEDVTNTTSVGIDYTVPEHVVIVIQTSVRRHLAKKELQKVKNIIKLQAVARGFLVRRQAAGTLRCIQAIVKMQALVRARRSFQLMTLAGKNNLKEHIPADVAKQTNTGQNKASSAIRKSVSSAFARQLLESTPKTKSIRISCDPLKPDSAWTWLERWMALTQLSQKNLVLNPDDLDKDVKTDEAACDVDDRLHIIQGHASSDSELTTNSLKLLKFEADLITKCLMKVELSPSHVSDQHSTSSIQVSVAERGAKVGSDYISNQIQQPLDTNLHFEPDGDSNKHDYTDNDNKNSGRKEPTPEIGSKAVNGSRKLMNPAFAAVQAKFEEMSSTPGSNRCSDHATRDVVSVSNLTHSEVNFTSNNFSATKTVHSMLEHKLDEVNMNGKLNNPNPEGQFTSSKYGIEISVPSLDRQEASISELVQEIRILDQTNVDVEGMANGSLKFNEIKIETENNGAISVDSFDELGVLKQPENNGAISVDSIDELGVLKHPTEITMCSNHTQEKDTEDSYVDRRSLYGSSRSHTDFLASPSTPSSQVSLHVRTSVAENNVSARKSRSQVSVKNSPTSSKSDSDTRSSMEHLRKTTMGVKRPNSSGNDKGNHVGNGDEGSWNSLPNYMQPTESAKAKVNMTVCHKLDNSVRHKESYIKKRHSLPIVNERHNLSPRVESSIAQTAQAKGISVSSHNPTDRRWLI